MGAAKRGLLRHGGQLQQFAQVGPLAQPGRGLAVGPAQGLPHDQHGEELRLRELAWTERVGVSGKALPADLDGPLRNGEDVVCRP